MRDDRSTRFEGRRLPRPRDEVVDQGLGFDLGTLVTRRRFLTVLGVGAVGVGAAACGAGAATTTATTGASSATATTAAAGTAATAALAEIPEETAGPYPGDGSNGPDVLSESGIVRSDLTRSVGSASGVAEGVPMTLTLAVTDLATGGPMTGAAVYVWHCDAAGRYSMYSDGVTDENYLRGVQVVGADGTVTFTSIVPACYQGRWPHVHLEVYPDVGSITDAGNVVATSQVAVPQDVADAVYATPGYEASVANLARVSLATDMVFADGAELETPTVTGDVSSGYRLAMPVGVDLRTAAGSGGSAPGGGAPGGAPTR